MHAQRRPLGAKLHKTKIPNIITEKNVQLKQIY